MNQAKQNCRKYREQNCGQCDDYGCGDNMNPEGAEKLLYVRVTREVDGGKGGFTDLPRDIGVSDLFDGADAGEAYVLRAVEMSRREYAKLPEFTGW